MRIGRSLRFAAAAAILVAGAGSGCIDFVEPEEREPRRGELRVELLITSPPKPEAEIEGRLLRTRGDDGRLAPVSDSAVRLFGRRLAPESGGDEDVLSYRAEWTLTAAERGQPRFELGGPRTGPDRRRVRIAFPLIGRMGPDSLVPDRDEDLRLPLSLGSADAYGNVGSLSWNLVISEAGAEASLLILRGTGRPPDTLRVARDLLATAPPGAALEAVFFARMNTRRSGPDLPYDVQLDATTAVEWTVVLE